MNYERNVEDNIFSDKIKPDSQILIVVDCHKIRKKAGSTCTVQILSKYICRYIKKYFKMLKEYIKKAGSTCTVQILSKYICIYIKKIFKNIKRIYKKKRGVPAQCTGQILSKYICRYKKCKKRNIQ